MLRMVNGGGRGGGVSLNKTGHDCTGTIRTADNPRAENKNIVFKSRAEKPRTVYTFHCELVKLISK